MHTLLSKVMGLLGAQDASLLRLAAVLLSLLLDGRLAGYPGAGRSLIDGGNNFRWIAIFR